MPYSSKSTNHGQLAHSPAASEQGELPPGRRDRRKTPGIRCPVAPFRGRELAGHGPACGARDPRARPRCAPAAPVPAGRAEGPPAAGPALRRARQDRAGGHSSRGQALSRHTGPCAGPFPPAASRCGAGPLCGAGPGCPRPLQAAATAGAARSRPRRRAREDPPSWPAWPRSPPSAPRTHPQAPPPPLPRLPGRGVGTDARTCSRTVRE